MQVKYYERKRDTGLVSKPMLERVFALKHAAAAKHKAVKKVILTKEEYEAIKAELKQLEEDVNFYNLVNNEETVSHMLGADIEVMDDLIESDDSPNSESVKKLADDKAA